MHTSLWSFFLTFSHTDTPLRLAQLPFLVPPTLWVLPFFPMQSIYHIYIYSTSYICVYRHAHILYMRDNMVSLSLCLTVLTWLDWLRICYHVCVFKESSLLYWSCALFFQHTFNSLLPFIFLYEKPILCLVSYLSKILNCITKLISWCHTDAFFSL